VVVAEAAQQQHVRALAGLDVVEVDAVDECDGHDAL
jgi:hypothetical protein